MLKVTSGETPFKKMDLKSLKKGGKKRKRETNFGKLWFEINGQ